VASHFADRMCEAVKKKNTPLIVGLDPVFARLPAAIRGRNKSRTPDLAAELDGLFEFCAKVIKIVAPLVPAIKINIAYFEKYLWDGLETYYALINEADANDIETIGDVKRGDIGHTAQCYAEAHLKNPDFESIDYVITPDAITVNGFAGAEGIVPFADAAEQQGKGVFVWVRASNPSAAILQDAADAAGVKMYERLAAVVGDIANQTKRLGQQGYSCVGMVVGGTTPAETAVLRQRYPRCWFLVPGFGTQGATAADCLRFADKDGLGVLINASRSILYAFDEPKYKEQFGDNWEKCIEQAAIDAKMEIAKARS